MSGNRKKSSFEASGFFVLRTPLLPFDALLSWTEGTDARRKVEDPSHREESFDEELRTLRNRLVEWIDRPEIREALFIASPDLIDRLHVWLGKPDSKKGRNIERALVKYFVRMAGRPTPFGLFAGCSVGRIGEETRFRLPERGRYRRRSRLDMDYLFALTEEVGKDRSLRDRLAYRPNGSLYLAGGRLHYSEARIKGRLRSYHLVAVNRSDYLEATLSRAAGGARIGNLAEALAADDPEVALEEAVEFIHELIDNQVLVSDLTPGVTGNEAIGRLLDDLRRLETAGDVVACLEGAHRDLEAVDACGLGQDADRYREIAAHLEPLSVKVDLPRLFQVDMFKTPECATLGPAAIGEIERGIEILMRIGGEGTAPELATFVERFNKRYQDREIPILEVLDEETGIGFGMQQTLGAEVSPLLRGIDLGQEAIGDSSWKPRDAWQLRKLLEVRESGAGEIDLEEKKIPDLVPPGKHLRLPEAFAVNVTLAAESDEAVDRGEYRLIMDGLHGPSGGRLLGRFSHGDEELERHLRSHLEQEEALHPDAVFAEVVHLPQGRLGNILSRPVLRNYEIPFLGRPGVESDRQIPVQDLLVSVRAGRIVLRSRRLGKEVIPRMTSAHNFSRQSLGVYKFLCTLQLQGIVPYLVWSWGPLSQVDHLPRVTCGRLILSLARWTISREEIVELAKGDQDRDRYLAAQRLREKRRLPRFFLLEDGDNRLPVDMDNILSVDTWIDLIRKRTQAVVVELFPGPDQMPITGPEGRFVHQIVVPFVRKAAARTESIRPATVSHQAGDRSKFAPGSEWLYAKLYSGPASADQLLREAVTPVTRQAQASGAADGWFFIRYADPDTHLRLRYHGKPDRLLGEVLPLLKEACEPFLSRGQLWNLQLDSYDREVERYGGTVGSGWRKPCFMRTAKRFWPWCSSSPETRERTCDGGSPSVGSTSSSTTAALTSTPGGNWFDPAGRGWAKSSVCRSRRGSNWETGSGRRGRAWSIS